MKPAWLQQIVAEAFELFVVLDLDERLMFLSRGVDERTPENSVGIRVSEFLPSPERERWQAAWRACLATRKPQDIPALHVMNRTYRVRLVPLLTDRGELEAVATVNVDVTREQDTAQRLRVRDQQLRLALEASRMGQWSWDIARDEVTWDRATKRIFGWAEDRDDVTYAAFLERIHPADRERVAAHVRRAVETGTYPNLEARTLMDDGAAGWVLITGAVLKDEDGRATHLLGGVVDLTQSKRDEARVHRAQKLEAIGQLAGGVAHDFNNLLIAIMGNVDLAKRANDDQGRASFLKDATVACQRAADLTRQLLAFSRRQQLHRDQVDVTAMVADTVHLLRRLLPASLEVVVVSDGEPLVVTGDRAQLEQVVVNLCVNARDAMPAGGSIEIAVTKVGPRDPRVAAQSSGSSVGHACIRVSDTGAGMAPDVVESVFEPFFTTKEHGTGLGLSSAYGTVTQHGGTILASSELGRGSTFEVFLPLAESGGLAPPAPDVPRPEGGVETILVAEDDGAVRKVLVKMLTSAGYRVLEARDGQQALAVFRAERDVALALVDGVMPKLSGLEVARKIHAERPGVAIVLSSGYVTELESPQTRHLDAILQKPYEAADLLQTVRDLLERRKERTRT